MHTLLYRADEDPPHFLHSPVLAAVLGVVGFGIFGTLAWLFFTVCKSGREMQEERKMSGEQVF